ncbi:OmpA family protein [Hymenobacter coccineus]|uniref:OmpA-like domain-containing protein n=1 Tax=Hymenobacter coccineus TaxID=1908235 RepID=A0A1G1THG3_9BACT|nr:OmpA family protein [Hymenobacter coccineus]OGX90316.1 hypothetical protein BEN49_07085 [Hymenobacter coccineus]
MTTLHNMPEDIKNFLRAHGLAPTGPLAAEHQVGVQLAISRVADLVMSTFEELAGQPGGRDTLWNAARAAHATPQPDADADLVKTTLDDRYHGKVHGVATAAGIQTASVNQLVEQVSGAALSIMGGLVNQNNWTAQDLSQWLRPHPGTATAGAPLAAAEYAAMPAPAAAATAGASSWVARHANALLLGVGFIAVAEFGYILGTRNPDAEVATTTAAPVAEAGAPTGRPYTAVPVASITSAADAARGKTAVPVVLKLKNGVRQIIGSNSTESKLYQFLIDPTKEVDMMDPAKGWIGFDRIYFESNKAILTNESLWQLSNIASILKRFPAAKVKLGGYTDNSGSAYINLRLSQERAKAAMTTLVSMGVPSDRLTSVGYGALDGIADNDTEEGRSLNRRVSMQVVQK